MVAAIAVTPDPITTGTTDVDVDLTGLEDRRTKLLLNGVQQGAEFRPTAGAWSQTVPVSGTDTTYHFSVQQCVAGTFSDVVARDVTGDDAPDAGGLLTDLTGWDLRFADYFDRVIAEGDFVDGGNYSPPGVSGIKTADGRYVVYKDGWSDTTGHGKYDPSIASVDGSKLRVHIQSKLNSSGVQVPRVFAMIVLPSGSSAKGGLLGLRYLVRLRTDALPNYKVVPLLWADLSATNDDLMQYGEIDWPEGETVDSPHGFMHRTGSTSLSDQYVAIPSPDTVDMSSWHDYVVEWRAGTSCKFFIDGTQVGTTQTSRVPNTAMHLVLQFETQTGGAPIPSSGVSGYIEVDTVGVWAAA